MKNSLQNAPYDVHGNLLHYADPRYSGTYAGAPVRWLPNDPMELTLSISTVISGRSAKYLLWMAPNGLLYPMFVADLIDMMRDSVIVKGTVIGVFRVRKRGMNFGLCYVGPTPKDGS